MADRNGVQRARFDTPKVVNFADPKGPEWMAKLGLTEDKVAAKAGRYTRGRNKGQVRGGVVILRCVEGGWYKGDAVFSGRVIYPGTTWLAVFWGEKDLGGLVYGTTANLIGQGYMLGRDGQATHAFNPPPAPVGMSEADAANQVAREALAAFPPAVVKGFTAAGALNLSDWMMDRKAALMDGSAQPSPYLVTESGQPVAQNW